MPDNSKLEGSVDIDKATAKIYPNDNRWDYALSYDGEEFFIVVHTGSNLIEEDIERFDWDWN